MGTASAILFLGKLQRTLQRTRAQAETETPETEERPVPAPGVPLTPPPQSQEAAGGALCSLCGERLFLLERIGADGRFFHRSCFRCHICEATLWPGGYGQHPGDGLYYCLQHLPAPGHQEESRDRGPGSLKRLTPGDHGLPPAPSSPTAPQAEASPARNASQTTRRLIRLSSPERQQLSCLSLTPDPEVEPPPKPPRCRVPAQGPPGLPSSAFEDLAKECESSLSSEEEEEAEQEDVALDETTEQALLMFAKNLGTMNKYPTWRRTLLRRAKEEEMKRFCKAQSIQRQLNEIEVSLGELEAEGKKLELALRRHSSSPEQQKQLWLEQLLQLVQKKNRLVDEEAQLMIQAQELNLEEKQWQLDQELRGYMNQEESLKTAAERQAEQQVLSQLLDVVNQRDNLIRFQEQRRLSELALGCGAQG